MSSRSSGSAENSFFQAILDDTPLEKGAVELAPETAELLGTPSVSPQDLNQLEESASNGLQGEEPPEEVSAEEPPPEEEAEFVPDRQSDGGLFSSRRAHPLRILETLTLKYGEDWVDWEPETLWWAIRKDFGPLGEIAQNKIGALKVATKTDTPWLDWDTFEDVTLSWNDIIPIFGTVQLTTPAQAAFGVQVLRGIRPEEEFGDEVSIYMAAILEDHGYVYAPEEWFPGAQALLDRREHTRELRVDVENAFSKLRDIDPAMVKWDPTNPLDVHVLKLITIGRYLKAREDMADESATGSIATSTAPPVP